MEQQQKQQQPDLVYLQAAVTEYMAALTSEGLPLPDVLLSLSLQVQVSRNSAGTAALSVYCGFPGLHGSSSTEQPTAAIAVSRKLDKVASNSMESTLVPIAAVASASYILAMRSSLAGESSSGAKLAIAASSAAAFGSNGHNSAAMPYHPAPAEQAVKRLLAAGQVLQAARLVRRLHVETLHPAMILEAAAVRRDRAVFASVYRCFRDSLIATYPRLEVAYDKLMSV
jgi:hypothetical protein